MSATTDALDIAAALLLLVTRAAEAAGKITTAVQKAKAEGRDLTDGELRAALQERERAYAEWQKLGGES
jgi:hypothetical protein